MKLKEIETKKIQEVSFEDAYIAKTLNSKVYNYSDGACIFINDQKIRIGEKIENFLNILEEKEYEWEIKSEKIVFIDDDDNEIEFYGKEMLYNEIPDKRFGDVYDFDEIVKKLK